MASKWVSSPTYKWGIPWGYNPLILTIDPNFQRDIQVLNQLQVHGEALCCSVSQCGKKSR